MTAKKPTSRHARTAGQRKRRTEEKARRQVLDDLDDLHEHVQGLEDTLADIAEIQRVTTAATVVMARAIHGLLDFASQEISKAAGGIRPEGLEDLLETLGGELEKLEDAHSLMDHLDQYRQEVLKP